MTTEQFVREITQTFSTRHWTDDSDQQSVRDLVKLSESLDADEIEMLAHLIQRFQFVKFSQYEGQIKRSLLNIPSETLEQVTEIHVSALVSEDKRNQTKSSTFIAYLFKSQDFLRTSALKDKVVLLSDSPASVIGRINDDVNRRLFLVDDFLGTGDTALKCITPLLDAGLLKERIVIITAAAMQFGADMLSSQGVPVYSSILLDKGISSIEDSEVREKYVRLMTAIESRYNVSAPYRFGYGQSESLIKLIRPPNNTFPLFWWSKMPTVVFPR